MSWEHTKNIYIYKVHSLTSGECLELNSASKQRKQNNEKWFFFWLFLYDIAAKQQQQITKKKMLEKSFQRFTSLMKWKTWNISRKWINRKKRKINFCTKLRIARDFTLIKWKQKKKTSRKEATNARDFLEWQVIRKMIRRVKIPVEHYKMPEV